MIERIVLLKLRDELAHSEGRSAVARELASMFEGDSSAVRVGLPADEAAEKSWDLCVTFSFEPKDPTSPVEPEAIALAALGDRVWVKKAWSFRSVY